jgi:hypothetical protein
MKKFLCFNLVALPITMFLTVLGLEKWEVESAWYSCEVLLLVTNIHISSAFFVCFVGSFILMLSNHGAHGDEQFVDPATFQLVPEAQLSANATAKKRWLQFLMIAFPLTLALMPAIGILRSYLAMNGMCVLVN